MKKFITNRVVLNTIILLVFTYSMELIIRSFSGASFKEFPMIRIFISSLIMSLFVSWIGHFMPKLGQRILNIVYVLLVGILEFVEFGLSSYIGFFMGIGNAGQGAKVGEFIRDFASSYKAYHWLGLLPIIIFLVYFIFFDKKVFKNKERNTEMSKTKKVVIEVITFLILISLSGLYYFTIRSKKFENKLQIDSNYSLWLYPENSNLTVNNFGVFMYVFADIKSNIMGVTADDVMKLSNQSIKESTPKVEVAPDYERKIDDTAWNTLIDNTNNYTYNNLNKYFMSRTITPKNEMTGLFKDKNLIVILMESVNEISILNEEYFPTLYKMYHEGISFKNNYSPRNNCSTGNNEFTVLSGLFTINNTCTANTYSTNKYPEASFNIFKNSGYLTAGFHDYTQKFYSRARTIPNLGADKYYGVEALKIPYSQSYTEANDKDMFIAAKQYYMDADKFMVYFASVTPHQSYIASQTCSDMYYQKYRDLGYSSNLSRYLSKMQVFDEALKELLDELEAEGKLDDTVIALFGDHFPYGLVDSQINEYFEKNNAGYKINRNSTTNKNVDKTPLIIYNAKTEPIVVEKYTTILDLLPTLLNLFDMDYDPRLYLGTDAFSELHQSRAVFADGSWTNERGYYHAPANRMNYLDGAEEYNTEEMRSINQEINTRQKMSASAIKSNYFKYLGEGLEKYKTTEIQETQAEENIEE